MEKNTVQLPRHTLMLDGRARAKLTGVTAVSCFNDREVVLETGEGEVTLEDAQRSRANAPLEQMLALAK